MGEVRVSQIMASLCPGSTQILIRGPLVSPVRIMIRPPSLSKCPLNIENKWLGSEITHKTKGNGYVSIDSKPQPSQHCV